MILNSKLELISVCEHLHYGISTTQTYYENYLQRLSSGNSEVLRRVVDNLEYIVLALSRVEKMLCSDSPNMFSAYNELDKLYTRIISNQFVPGAIRATVYEIHYELKRLLYGEPEKDPLKAF